MCLKVTETGLELVTSPHAAASNWSSTTAGEAQFVFSLQQRNYKSVNP